MRSARGDGAAAASAPATTAHSTIHPAAAAHASTPASESEHDGHRAEGDEEGKAAGDVRLSATV